jgi:fused signal recognition particle receptor
MFKSLKEKLGSLFSKKEDKVIEIKEKEEPIKEAKEPAKKEKKQKEDKETKQEETNQTKVETSSVGVEVSDSDLTNSSKNKNRNQNRELGGAEVKTKEEKKEEKQPKEQKPSKEKEQPKEEIKEENKEELDHAIEQIEEEKLDIPKQGFLEKIRGKLGTTKLDQDTFDEFFEELESMLLENNVALDVVDKIKQDMEADLVDLEIKRGDIEDQIKKSLKESLNNLLIEPFDILRKIRFKEDPYVILFFGINGAGKTTTIAKFANYLKKHKITTVIAAADTFRAASIEQLETHGKNLGIKIISQDYGADPAAVGFDAIANAKSLGTQCVLIDTAGRMHTKSDLMREMEKIIRVCKPDLKIFVAESITGNDAVEQAKAFDKSFEIDGSILTKADVDERGGTMISIGHTTKKPILFLGTGQEYKDLEPFSKKEIISNLGLD